MPDLLDLTVEIVTAHLANNMIDADCLPALIRTVYAALAGAGRQDAAAGSSKPAVPIRQSVFHDRIMCLGCGKSFRTLKRHLQADHQLTVDAYRRRYGLPQDYPVIARGYAETRQGIAHRIGLGRNTRRNWV